MISKITVIPLINTSPLLALCGYRTIRTGLKFNTCEIREERDKDLVSETKRETSELLEQQKTGVNQTYLLGLKVRY